MEPEYAALDAWYVVIDTSVIHDDFDLSHRDTLALMEAAPGLNLRVCIPEVVVLEMVAHYQPALNRAVKNHEESRHLLSQALGRELGQGFVASELDRVVGAYEGRLRQRLRELGIRLLPLPGSRTALKSLVQRGRLKRKPLRQDGQGLADALLWESVIELCRREPRPVVLVTKNTHDFALQSSKSQLHRDLVEDLSAVGVERAELYTSVSAFTTARLRLMAGESPEPGQRPQTELGLSQDEQIEGGSDL